MLGAHFLGMVAGDMQAVRPGVPTAPGLLLWVTGMRASASLLSALPALATGHLHKDPTGSSRPDKELTGMCLQMCCNVRGAHMETCCSASSSPRLLFVSKELQKRAINMPCQGLFNAS